jgi:prepilin-type N-terminal cleavage/methylation domain-containing protein
MGPPSRHTRAFTLIELLVVIAIIAILVGLLFPAFKAVQRQAREAQAKNDLTQIVNAVNAFYTEYGRYPLPTGNPCPAVATDITYGPSGTSTADLFYSLRAVTSGCNSLVSGTPAINPRQIVFISPPYVKDETAGKRRSGVSQTDGQYYDPWGTPYSVRIDANYDNQLTNPYTADTGAGPATLNQGVIAWSAGSDGKSPGYNGGTTTFSASDDVISWQ